jgi:hypothetical protein
MRPPTQHELTDPKAAFYYARDVIKGRWEQGEPIIATAPQWAYSYAISVIKERFELGEATIATVSVCAYWYALYVINGRFELGESIISTDGYFAYEYAKDFLILGIKIKIDIVFFEQCFRNNTLTIDDLPKKLQDNEDIQLAYFKAKVIK